MKIQDLILTLENKLKTLALLLIWFACSNLCAQTFTEFEKLVSDSISYQYGKNRQNLNIIEETIRNTQSADKRREIEKTLAKYLVDTKATLEFKEFVCRQLWYIGTSESVNAVATLLTNENTIGWACYALIRNPNKEATTALIKALDSVPESQKIKIISALGQKRDQDAVPHLSKYCSYNDLQIIEASIISLGQIASKNAVDILWNFTKSSNEKMVDLSSQALILCAEHLAKSGNAKEALEIYIRLFSLSTSLPVKSAAMRGIVLYSKDNGQNLIIQNLKSNDPKIRAIAIGSISLINNPEILRSIANSIPDLPITSQISAIHILTEKKERSLLPVVKKLINSEDKQVKIESIKAMGIIGDSSCIKQLADIMSNQDSQEKNMAKSSLKIIHNKGVEQEILKLLGKTESKSQIDIIDVVVARNMFDAVPQLLNICRSAAPDVQKAALSAIGQLGEPSILPQLLKLALNLNDDKIRAEAESSIISIARKIKEQNNRSSQIINSWTTVKNENAKVSILKIAGGIGDKTALEFLSRISQEESGNLQDTAIRELAQWEDASAIKILEKILKGTKNATHRVLAFRAYIRLLKSANTMSLSELFNRYTDALKYTENPDEKKLILSGLATIPTVDALNLSLQMLNEESVKNEAAQAILSISASIYGSDPQTVKRTLSALVKSDISENMRQQAAMLLKQIEEIGEYILSWEVAGPYSSNGKNYDTLFDIQFPPEQEKSEVKWIQAQSAKDPKRPYVIDLLKMFGGEQRVAYARTRVYSPSEQKARLEFGSDDGVKIWLNNQLIQSLNIARPLTPNSDKIDINLKQGWNTLMFKITQNNLGWEFCARIVSQDGKMIEGIRYSTTSN